MRHSQHDIPLALVYDELILPMGLGVRVRGGNPPRWRVADPEVEDFARLDNVVQGVHDLFDGRGVVELARECSLRSLVCKTHPVEIEDVDLQ